MDKQTLLEKLFATMQQMGRLMTQQAQISYEEKAATMLQFSALQLLNEKPKATMGELAQYLQMSMSSATQLIERLVKTGLVKRVHDTKDRRVIRLIITQKGKEQLTNLKNDILAKMNKFLSKIPEEDIQELLRIHNKILKTLKDQNNG